MSESNGEDVGFDELPVLPGSGLRHAWQVWGPGDNLGTLNRLTGPAVAAAAAAARTGERAGLSLPLDLPDPPFFGRRRFTHSNPSVEVVPSDPAVGSLHQRLIPHLGFAIGELFDFGPLARACRRAGRYEFLFASVPLNVPGAAGSPGNAVAIL